MPEEDRNKDENKEESNDMYDDDDDNVTFEDFYPCLDDDGLFLLALKDLYDKINSTFDPYSEKLKKTENPEFLDLYNALAKSTEFAMYENEKGERPYKELFSYIHNPIGSRFKAMAAIASNQIAAKYFEEEYKDMINLFFDDNKGIDEIIKDYDDEYKDDIFEFLAAFAGNPVAAEKFKEAYKNLFKFVADNSIDSTKYNINKIREAIRNNENAKKFEEYQRLFPPPAIKSNNNKQDNNDMKAFINAIQKRLEKIAEQIDNPEEFKNDIEKILAKYNKKN